MLPGIDGFEMCKRIKASNKCEAKIIMIIGQIDAFDATKANEVGADDYVVKDPEYVDLVEAVGKLINYDSNS